MSSCLSYISFLDQLLSLLECRLCHICPVLPFCYFALNLKLVLCAGHCQVFLARSALRAYFSPVGVVAISSQCHLLLPPFIFDPSTTQLLILCRTYCSWLFWPNPPMSDITGKFFFYLILLKISFRFFFQYFIFL